MKLTAQFKADFGAAWHELVYFLDYLSGTDDATDVWEVAAWVDSGAARKERRGFSFAGMLCDAERLDRIKSLLANHGLKVQVIPRISILRAVEQKFFRDGYKVVVRVTTESMKNVNEFNA